MDEITGYKLGTGTNYHFFQRAHAMGYDVLIPNHFCLYPRSSCRLSNILHKPGGVHCLTAALVRTAILGAGAPKIISRHP